MLYFDTHTHVISSDQEKYPVAPLGGVQSRWSLQRPATAEKLLSEMDAAGVDRAVLVQAATAYGIDNRYAADSLEKHRDRFVGVCTVDLLSDTIVEDLDYWIGERGFSGIRIRAAPGSTNITPPWRLDDEALGPAWAYLAEHHVSVVVQMKAEHTKALAEVLARFPDLTVVLDSAGHPRLDGGPPYTAATAELSALTGYDVYLKLTPGALEKPQRDPNGDPVALVRRLVEEFGPDRFIWGSNFPAEEGSVQSLLDLIRAAVDWLGPAEQSAIFGANAARIYRTD